MPRSEKHDSDDARNRASKRRRVGTDAASVRCGGCGDVVLFKEALRALRRAGWKAKPLPRRSLDTRYKYVRPGGNPAGAEDVDYVLGEGGVVAEYVKSVAVHGRGSAAAAVGSGGDGIGDDETAGFRDGVESEGSGGTGLSEYCGGGDGVCGSGVRGSDDGVGNGAVGDYGDGDSAGCDGDDTVGLRGGEGGRGDAGSVCAGGDDERGSAESAIRDSVRVDEAHRCGERSGFESLDAAGVAMQDAVVVNAQQQVEGSGRGGVQGRGRGRGTMAVEPAGRGQGPGRGRGCDSGRGRGEGRGRGRDSGRGRERQRGRSTESDQDESDAGSGAESDGGDDTSTRNGEVVPDRQTLCQLYTNTLVVFSPSRERWMTQKKYKHVGTTYIIERIC
ncbi:hypothetical protein F444_00695 [Phytophthora nicotianae P1976]|uniref:Uncharacterized protein n=1 Tax=Phytophthora nicotianae P1976 TaxID=1317066 RepID=A0A081B3E9_PHYNI|nr:hypothetical protein F444_00695 [Phytophthora nicotianae P1976]